MLTNSSLTRGRAFLLSWTVAFAAAGCSDETGLLVEVTRNEQTTAEIDQLRFYIGTAVTGSTFVEDETPLQLVDLGGPRDLLADPYKLLLRPGDVVQHADGTREPRIMVAVVGRVEGQDVAFGTFDEPKLFHDGKVLSWTITLGEGGEFDQADCLVFEQGKISSGDDADCDGDLVPNDCNDNDPSIGPSANEICENGVDDNCNDTVDEELDDDEDGFTNCDECDDSNELINPDAREICDGIDNDCDGTCDAEFDRDNDAYTDCGSKVLDGGATCLEPNSGRVDCDDENETAYPDAQELCDGFDNDCNQICDDGWDPDGDLFTECGSRVDLCNGTEDRDIDCEPEDENIHPGAVELCNGQDDNCDGIRYDAQSPCYEMGVTEGGMDVCVVGTRACADGDGALGWAECTVEGLVNDTTYRAPPELCDAYEICDAADVPDPFACANKMAADTSVFCSIEVEDPAGPDLCPQTYISIPRAEAVGCFWQIVGGKIQRHWEVGLSAFTAIDVPPTGSGEGSLNECAVWFQVVRATDSPPIHDSMILWSGDAMSERIIEVQLFPEPTLSCPVDGPGMVCDTFP